MLCVELCKRTRRPHQNKARLQKHSRGSSRGCTEWVIAHKLWMLHALCECCNTSVSSYLLVLCHGMGESEGLKSLLAYSGLLQLILRWSRVKQGWTISPTFYTCYFIGWMHCAHNTHLNACAKLCYKLGIKACSHLFTCTLTGLNSSTQEKMIH